MNDMDQPNAEPEVEILSSAPETFPDGVGSASSAPMREAETSIPEEPEEDWKARYEESRDKMLWLAAEFDNYKKRVLKEKEEHLKFASASVLKEFLAVADNLERALSAIPPGEAGGPAEGLKKGVDLTLKSFQNALQKHGVTRIAAKGEKFNPRVHEVMFEEKTDQAPDDTVLEELQTGYMLHERVLRPALVKVARNPNLA